MDTSLRTYWARHRAVLIRKAQEVGLTEAERATLAIAATNVEVLDQLAKEQDSGYQPVGAAA